MRQLHDIGSAFGMILHLADGGIGQRELLQVKLHGLGTWRLGRLLWLLLPGLGLLRLQNGVEVAAAIGILHQRDGWGGKANLIHVDIAADDVDRKSTRLNSSHLVISY